MVQMNNRQAQVIDPILTEQARGYTNAGFISGILLPRVPIPNRSMKVLKFGKEAFRQYLDTRRAPGAETKKVTFGYASSPVSLNQDALDAVVPVELMQDAAAVPNVDLAAHSINQVQNIIALGQEVAVANLVRNPDTYAPSGTAGLTGAQKWNDAQSNPAADIKAAANVIRRMIGRKPNVLVLSPRVFDVLSLHPRIQEQFRYTSPDSLSAEMLARYFNLEKLAVGEGVALPENASDDAPADDIWGNDAVLAYVPQNGSYMVPAFGYTYVLAGYPVVEQAFWENSRKSWIYGVTEEWRPYVTGAEGGFLFTAPAGKPGDGGGSADGGGLSGSVYAAPAVPAAKKAG